MGKIDRKKYPELDQLLWDTKTRLLDPKDALNTYERRWGLVEINALTAKEKDLIQNLAKDAGGFLVAHM